MSNLASIGTLRGAGKSTLAYHMASKAPVRVIFDGTPSRGTFRRDRPHQSIATTPDGIHAAMQTLGRIDLSAGENSTVEISEVLILPFDDLDEMFELTCVELRAWLAAEQDTLDDYGVVFLVDEVSMVTGRTMPPAFDYLARSAPLDVFHLIVTTHAPQDIPPRLRMLTSYWHLFRTTDANALDAIREKCGDDVTDAVQQLEHREYIFFDDTRKQFEIRRDANIWRPRELETAAA